MSEKRGRRPAGDEKMHKLTVWLPREVADWVRRRGRPSEVLREQLTSDYEEQLSKTETTE